MRKHENFKTYRELVGQIYKKNHLVLAASVFASVSGALFSVSISWFFKEALDMMQGIEGSFDLMTLLYIALGIVVFSVILYFIDFLTIPYFVRRALLQYKNHALEKLTGKSIAAFNDENISRYLSALTNDLNTIETEYINSHVNFAMYLVMFVASFGMMLFYSPLLTAIAVGLTFVPIFASVLVGGKMVSAEKVVSERNASFTALLKDALTGFAVVKSFKAESEMMTLLGENNIELEHSKFKKRRIKILINMVAQSAGAVAQLGILIAGAFMTAYGYPITAGTVLAFVNLMNFVIQPINQLPAIFAGRKASLALIKKLADALDKNVDDTGTIEIDVLKKAITFDSVSFGYEEGKDILKDISVVFEAGKSYAIVGGSGSGKSTLINLIMGAQRDYRGRIEFDAVEAKEIRAGSLFDLVSPIQQNVFIFDATIEDNITMFKNFPASEVAAAIENARLKELIDERGQGYLCGENGRELSGGEKQRISIARSLLKKSSVLLADEATSSLDAETASQVVRVIQSLSRVTRIVVTHALDAGLLRNYDGIIVMKDGMVIETGSFDELYSNKGYFYALYTVSQ